jgi:hypothetical protein
MDKQQPDCALEPAEVSQPAITRTAEQEANSLARLREIRDAAFNLLKQRGRHNTEIAYKRLEDAFRSKRNGQLPVGLAELPATVQSRPEQCLLSDAELADPEYMRGYVESMHEVIDDLLKALASSRVRDEVANGTAARSQKGFDGQ